MVEQWLDGPDPSDKHQKGWKGLGGGGGVFTREELLKVTVLGCKGCASFLFFSRGMWTSQTQPTFNYPSPRSCLRELLPSLGCGCPQCCYCGISRILTQQQEGTAKVDTLVQEMEPLHSHWSALPPSFIGKARELSVSDYRLKWLTLDWASCKQLRTDWTTSMQSA